jgi:hypothetical protein
MMDLIVDFVDVDSTNGFWCLFPLRRCVAEYSVDLFLWTEEICTAPLEIILACIFLYKSVQHLVNTTPSLTLPIDSLAGLLLRVS